MGGGLSIKGSQLYSKLVLDWLQSMTFKVWPSLSLLLDTLMFQLRLG